MKPFLGDRLQGKSVELFHHMASYKPQEIGRDEWDVETIRRHRVGTNGQLEFLTKWEGSDEETWEPAGNFVARYCYKLVEYLQKHSLPCDMGKVLSGTPSLG